MVSRRRILSLSRDELVASTPAFLEEQDDVWNNRERLVLDHVGEVEKKWESIDDEIWAKISVMERNRRVAKAYARAPVLTVNGSDEGFDGFRIGLSGFENPVRDLLTQKTISHIGQGFKLKMDAVGNILVKRVTNAPVAIVAINEENAIGEDVCKLPNGKPLTLNKAFVAFDMRKFQANLARESKRAYPDRRKLQSQCLTVIAFETLDNTENTANEDNLLNKPLWIICINIVAVEMMRSRLPALPTTSTTSQVRPRTRSVEPRAARGGFASGSSDEDPYSVAGSGSSRSSNGNNMGNNMGNVRLSRGQERPPKLPPRASPFVGLGPGLWAKTGQVSSDKGNKEKNEAKKHDDPYYSGLRARIPSFVKLRSSKKSKSSAAPSSFFSKKKHNNRLESTEAPVSLPPQFPAQPFWWHSRLYNGDDHDLQGQVFNTMYSESPASMSAATGSSMRQYVRNPTNFVPCITASGRSSKLSDQINSDHLEALGYFGNDEHKVHGR